MCKMPAAARGLQLYKAESLGRTRFEPQTCRQTYLLIEWFLELHFAAKNMLNYDLFYINQVN